MLKGSEKLRQIVPSDTILRAYLLLLHISHLLQENANDQLYKRAGITEIQYRALGYIVNNGGTIAASDLSHQLSRVRHNTTTLVYRLCNAELVTTDRDNRDRRRINIDITDKGQEVYDNAYPVAISIMKRVMSSISVEDATTLEVVLKVLEQNVLDNNLEETPNST
jgi:DNA-binding MarR family transcriptional regulator